MHRHFSSGSRRRATRGSLSIFLLAAVLALMVAAVTAPAVPRADTALAGGGPGVSLLAFYDFPRDDPRAVELSGITWDNVSQTLYAISDNTPAIVPLRPSAGYRTWSFGDVIAVSVPEQWDGEGIVRIDGGFFISNEFGPRVFALDAAGQTTAEVPLPAHFGRILRNRSLESLTITPDQRYLFTANETALDGDGPQPTQSAGTTVRILRYDRLTRDQVEYAYRTDTVFAPGEGGVGVVDMVALSATDLLVMERQFVPDTGNAIRIYRVGLAGAPNVIGIENLSESTPVVAKSLLVDLTSLPDAGIPEPRQPQPNRLLDNFEGLALGPLLADGRRALFVISDDNGSAAQTPRILVLAVSGL